jgi:hypothetical protein
MKGEGPRPAAREGVVKPIHTLYPFSTQEALAAFLDVSFTGRPREHIFTVVDISMMSLIHSSAAQAADRKPGAWLHWTTPVSGRLPPRRRALYSRGGFAHTHRDAALEPTVGVDGDGPRSSPRRRHEQVRLVSQRRLAHEVEAVEVHPLQREPPRG